MADQRWLIDTGRAGGGVVANSLNADMPEYHRGQSITFPFVFWEDSRLTDDHVTRYEALREYADWAGRHTIVQAISGQVHVAERVPAAASVSSIIVDIVPNTPADWPDTPGVWAVLDGVDDPTQFPDDTTHLDVTATVLAEADDYADRTALKNDIGVA